MPRSVKLINLLFTHLHFLFSLTIQRTLRRYPRTTTYRPHSVVLAPLALRPLKPLTPTIIILDFLTFRVNTKELYMCPFLNRFNNCSTLILAFDSNFQTLSNCINILSVPLFNHKIVQFCSQPSTSDL